MIVLTRPIRFEEVDAAQIVFFARYLNYAHEAMEHFFSSLEGGYARLIVERQIGLPAVDVQMSFWKPMRYGDTLRIETSVARLGNRSVTLRYRMYNAATDELCAKVDHTVVTSDLSQLKSCDMPPDVRAQLEAHLEMGASRAP